MTEPTSADYLAFMTEFSRRVRDKAALDDLERGADLIHYDENGEWMFQVIASQVVSYMSYRADELGEADTFVRLMSAFMNADDQSRHDGTEGAR